MNKWVNVAVVVLLLATIFSSTAVHALSSAAKVEKLNELQTKASSHVISLDTKTFNLFTESPRNYSIIVVLTATEPGQACDLCQRFAKEYEIVGESWYSMGKPGRLYLTTLEYRVGQEVFAKLRIGTAPQIYHFPPTEGKHAKPEHTRDPNKFESYDMARGAEAEEFVRFIESILGHEVPIKRPIDYSRFIITALLAVGCIAVARLAWERFHENLRQPWIWSTLAMLFTLFFISGHAWNSIRGAPFSGREAIAPSFQSQYGVETRLVAFLYGAASFSFIMLAVHVPTISKPNLQRAFAYGYTAVFFVACSAVVAVFRIKYGPYPFRLLF